MEKEELTKTKNVALALSSGGARGLAHIGAIEELEAQGYHISSIAGCSMGALIGGVYAAGKLNEFHESTPVESCQATGWRYSRRC